MTLQPTSRTAGVTFVELMVAVIVFGIIALGVVPLFRDVPAPVSKEAPVSNSVSQSETEFIKQAMVIARSSRGATEAVAAPHPGSPPLAASSTPKNSKGAGQLEAPVISVPSGEFPITEFDLPLFVYNPNRKGSSRILYSVNDGGWIVYDGSPVMVSPGAEVTAYAEAIDSNRSNSKMAKENYRATPVELDPPMIRLSAARFDFDANEIIEIVLENPNKLDSSVMEYRASGTRWDRYEGPFKMHVDDNPIGAVIEARAVPAKALYVESNVSYKNIEKVTQETSFSSAASTNSRGEELQVHDEASASGRL